MKHFVEDDGFNVFRLPVGWQFLTNDVLGGAVDEDNFEEYDTLVQACINSGAAACIVDVHNYARWDKGVCCSFSHPFGHAPYRDLVLDHWPGWSH